MNQDEQIMEIKELNQKIAQEPNNADLYLDLAQIYFDQKDFDNALLVFSKFIEFSSDIKISFVRYFLKMCSSYDQIRTLCQLVVKRNFKFLIRSFELFFDLRSYAFFSNDYVDKIIELDFEFKSPDQLCLACSNIFDEVRFLKHSKSSNDIELMKMQCKITLIDDIRKNILLDFLDNDDEYITKHNRNIREISSLFTEISISLNDLYIETLLKAEQEKQQARLEERNLIIQKQAHDIKNMLSSVSAPMSIVQNKINSPLLKQALKANQLMSRAIDAISQSFGVNPDDFYYDAKNNENGVTLNDLIWSALDNSISNIMANNNRMKQFTNNYFASANWKQANSDYANLEEHDKHEIISEFKTFISKYFFQLEIDFDNSADIKIGTTKSSDFNLLSLFNELILNAVKYASYTEFEKRKVVISLANNGNEIVFSVSNSSMKTIDTKTAGTGNLILENFTKLISCKFETNYSEADAMYSSKLILNNFWENKDV